MSGFTFPGNGAVFDPETTAAMAQAFEDVCKALKVDGDAREREAIASRILELARRGERDPLKLRDRLLQEAATSRAAG